MNKRVFLIVLDSFGIGEMPDAFKFGDEGANTLRSVSKSPYFDLRNLKIGSVIAMNADIKVDLAKDDDFSYTCK